MSEIQDIIDKLIEFRDQRDWEQFHDSKNLALAISIESAELNELFLWQTDEESDQIDLSKLKEELADVFSFAFLLAHKHNLDVKEIILDKIKINGQKYLVSKSKGIATKYDDLWSFTQKILILLMLVYVYLCICINEHPVGRGSKE